MDERVWVLVRVRVMVRGLMLGLEYQGQMIRLGLICFVHFCGTVHALKPGIALEVGNAVRSSVYL